MKKSMKKKSIFSLVWPGMILLAVMMLVACDKDKDEPQPVLEKGAPCQVTVVFAPGELGDRGYADNVLEGIVQIQQKMKDSLDVQFISRFDIKETQQALLDWAKQPANPYYEGVYERRLLVLSNPIMVSWLSTIKNVLRPTDEVLLLKVNGDDVEKAAATYGLGNRLHGLNISMAKSVRKFCQFMDDYLEIAEELTGKELNYDSIPIYRLHGESEMVYRDSLIETLAEEVPDTKLNIQAFSDAFSIYSLENASKLLGLATNVAVRCDNEYKLDNNAFAIVDLGTFNTGWDFYVQGKSYVDTFVSLMLDADLSLFTENRRYAILRSFDTALVNWVGEWMLQATEGMPRMKQYSGGELCADNIPDYDYLKDVIFDDDNQ